MVKRVSVFENSIQNFIASISASIDTINIKHIDQALRNEQIDAHLIVTTGFGDIREWVVEFQNENDYTYFRLKWE